MTRISLYDQAPKQWDQIAASGRPNVALMARHFHDRRDMDDALGFVKACGNWMRRGWGVSNSAEALAGKWVQENLRPGPVIQESPAPEPAKPATAGTMLLVIAPDPDKATRVLRLLGCEVEAV
jgi:hypothetical protein